VGPQASTTGDPQKGQALFQRRCTGCHALDTDHEGPRLRGVYGSPSAAVAGYAYSQTLTTAHIVWNDDTLDRWLTDPDAMLPGNNMDLRVPRPDERRDLIRYLKQLSSP
jgi:cytochrome c